MKSIFLLITMLVFLCSTSCKSYNEDEKDNTETSKIIFSGKVVDVSTQLAIPNIQISLLDKGPTKTTGDDGKFYFSENEVLSLGSLTQKDLDSIKTGFAVSAIGTSYHQREANLALDSLVTIEMIPDSSNTYYYQKPVQFNDGLATSTLLAENMDTSLIQQLMNKLTAGDYKEIHSILVYKNNKLVLEEYFYGNNDTIQFENNIARDKTPPHIQWGRNQKHYIASVNKALTSTVVGIALDKFGKSVNDKISIYLPEYSTYFVNAGKNNVTIKNCLTMSMGFKWDEWTSNDLALLWHSTDFTEFLLSRNTNGPNSEWRYNSASPNVLLHCLQNMVGEPIRKWADENFYAKLGITDYDWQSQPGGLPEGAARMFIRPRDMLKVGATYLNNGVWNGEQVIPAAWVTECSNIKKITSSGNYSYFFWLRSLAGAKYVSADGDGGNYINIFPTLNMVIVITQGNYLEYPLYVNQANDIMENYIIPAAK